MFAPAVTVDPCNHGAAVTRVPHPTAPSSAYESITGRYASATLQVRIDGNGQPTSVRVTRSTGNSALDAAAMQSAKGSTFRPAAAGCGTVPSTYAMTFNFPKQDYGCNHDAAVLAAFPPRFPPTAMPISPPAANSTAPPGRYTVRVGVTIDPAGNVVNEKIAQTSRFMQTDLSALEAARRSIYVPKDVNCYQIESSYLFRVDLVVPP